MTTGDIAAHLEEVYDTTISKDLVSRAAEKVLERQARPLDPVSPESLCDAIVLKVRANAASRAAAATVGKPSGHVAMGIRLAASAASWGCGFGPTAAREPSSG